MKKKILLVCIIVCLLIIDNTLMPMIGISGISPSILFIFCISIAFYTDISEAIFVGSISGILQDIFFADAIGINAILNMLLCVLVAYMGKNFIKSKLVVPIVMVFFATFAKDLILILAYGSMGYTMFIKEGIYKAIYNLVVAGIFEKIIFRFYNLESIKTNWKF